MVGNLFSAGIQQENRVRFNAHAPSESFFKVGQMEEKLVPTDVTFSPVI